MTSQQTNRRHEPRQARARATVERILRTSALLLEEVGLEGFNTNLLAERAEVGMHAIYRYFPNKNAILATLTEQMRSTEREWVGDLSALDGDGDWRRAVNQAIMRYYEAAAARPGYAALRNAARASVEIQAVDRVFSLELEDNLARGLARLGIDISPQRMQAVCRTIMECATRMLDVALQSPSEQARPIVDELSTMIVAYLATFLPTEPTA